MAKLVTLYIDEEELATLIEEDLAGVLEMDLGSGNSKTAYYLKNLPELLFRVEDIELRLNRLENPGDD